MTARKTSEDKAEDAAVAEVGGAEVQEKVDAENEQGFRGAEVDPTPNEHYTVQGVAAGLPTPETDEKAAADADAHHLKLGSKFGYREGDSA